MAHGYEAWRISFQSSEQAAKAAWHNWQQESINYALEQDDFREYRVITAKPASRLLPMRLTLEGV